MSPLATWQGPFDAFLPNGTRLNIGDEYDVGDIELRSAHWQRVPAAKPQPTPTPTEPAKEATD